MMDSSNAALKDVTIVDAPDTKFRGIVEGFYGQYSHKERMDLLKFMGPLKMNTYIMVLSLMNIIEVNGVNLIQKLKSMN